MRILFWRGKDQDVCKRMILKCILRKKMGSCGPDSPVSAHGPLAFSREHGSEHSGSIICGEFLD